MSGNDSDAFEHLWADVNGITQTEWDEIRDLAGQIEDAMHFKGDPFKCAIGAFVLWFKNGNGRPERPMDQASELH